MKSRRSAPTVVGLFAAALVAWLVFRSHFSPSTEKSPAPSIADRSQATPTQVEASPPSEATAAVTPLASPLPGAVAALAQGSLPASSVVSAAQALPVSAAADTARSDAASINAIKVRRMITDYHTLNGENPVGTNAEIMASVMGRNSRQAVLGPPEGMGLNSKGELVDDWGTPYFFHQLSRDVMEIHSAGPDKIMGTADDIVVR